MTALDGSGYHTAHAHSHAVSDPIVKLSTRRMVVMHAHDSGDSRVCIAVHTIQ